MKKHFTLTVQGGAMAALVLSVAGAAAGGDCTPGIDDAFGLPGMGGGVFSFAVLDDGTGEALYAGGNFTSAGGFPANRVARWNGSNWSPLGTGMSNAEVYALASFGGNLYAAGYFDSAGGVAGTAKLARWNGSAWQSLGANLELWSNQLWALETADLGDGEALYIGGNFTDIAGIADGDFLAKWDGSSFSAMGAPIGGAVPLVIFGIHSWDDGNGPALYVGGRFLSIDGVPASRIAKFDGKQWSSLGAGITTGGATPAVYAMATFDDGTGEALYAAGQTFTSVDGIPANRVARWDGSQWSPVGDGFADGIVWDLEVFDDGDGEALYAFGTFTMSGTTPVSRIARWNGTSWEPVGTGANASLYAAKVFDDGSGSALYIGGNNLSAIDGVATNNIARYNGCFTEPIIGDLNGDGLVDVSDLLLLLAAWGDCDKGECPADLTNDGVVDVSDLLALLSNWG